MSRGPTFSFQLSIMTKWLSNRISSKVSFKITLRRTYVYLDIRWPWIWTQFPYLGFRNFERSKTIFLPSCQLLTRLNSQNRNETSLLMNSDTLIFMNIVISNWHNSSFDPHENVIFTLFQFLTRLLNSKHLKLITT